MFLFGVLCLLLLSFFIMYHRNPYEIITFIQSARAVCKFGYFYISTKIKSKFTKQSETLVIVDNIRWIKKDYTYHNKPYTILTRVPRFLNPTPMLLVKDENGNDITSIILQYMGPMRDWHGLKGKIGPKHLGFSKVIFVYENGKEIVIDTLFE